MPITRFALMRRPMTLAVVAIFGLLSACGSTTSGESGPAALAGTATPTSAPMPNSLKDSLAGTGIVVEDRTFGEGESESEALKALGEEYDLASYGDKPEVFPMVIRSSLDTQLQPGMAVTVVHIGNVPQDASGPIHADGSTPEPVTVETDMFGFVSPDGAFLETTYIGPSPPK